MKLKVNRSGRASTYVGLLLTTALLVSCGGDGTPVNSFRPTRLIALGDETSVINPADGSKYTVNAVKSDKVTIDCAANPIWVQSLASVYGLVFPECNPQALPAPPSRIWARNGALVADLADQIGNQVNSGGFASDDLVTVLVGTHDIETQFLRYPAVDEGTLRDNLQRAGADLAAQVNAIAELGAKVLVSTAPDLGRSPFAGDRSAGSTNVSPGVLSRLSTAFNDGLLGKLTNDGRKIGLVQLDAYVQQVDSVRIAGGGSFFNTTLGACLASAPPPVCTTELLGTDAAAIPPPTVVSTASGVTWLWADALHLSAGGQAGLGAMAITRAQNNPF